MSVGEMAFRYFFVYGNNDDGDALQVSVEQMLILLTLVDFELSSAAGAPLAGISEVEALRRFFVSARDLRGDW